MTRQAKAKDIMSTELIVGSENITVAEAIKLLVNNRITGFPVVDKTNRLIGVLSELDIIKSLQLLKDDEVMDMNSIVEYTRTVRSIAEDTDWQEILKTFVEKKIRRLPVIDKEGHLKGIITRRDIMKTIFYRSKQS